MISVHIDFQDNHVDITLLKDGEVVIYKREFDADGINEAIKELIEEIEYEKS